MKYRNFLNHEPLSIAFLGITPFVMRVKPSAEQGALKTRDATAQPFDQVKHRTQEAAQEMKDDGDLQEDFHQGRQWVSEKIAP